MRQLRAVTQPLSKAPLLGAPEEQRPAATTPPALGREPEKAAVGAGAQLLVGVLQPAAMVVTAGLAQQGGPGPVSAVPAVVKVPAPAWSHSQLEQP